ncbi:MAG: hypothetical protein WC254_01885, partial [Candidatus Woesearchaeota archaeon]
MKTTLTTTLTALTLIAGIGAARTAYATPEAAYAATQSGNLSVGASVEFMPGTYHIGDRVSTQVNIDAKVGGQYAPVSGYNVQLFASPAETITNISDDRTLRNGHFNVTYTPARTVSGIELDYGTLVDLVDTTGRSLEPGKWIVYTQGTVGGINLRKDRISYDVLTIKANAPQPEEPEQDIPFVYEPGKIEAWLKAGITFTEGGWINPRWNSTFVP